MPSIDLFLISSAESKRWHVRMVGQRCRVCSIRGLRKGLAYTRVRRQCSHLKLRRLQGLSHDQDKQTNRYKINPISLAALFPFMSSGGASFELSTGVHPTFSLPASLDYSHKKILSGYFRMPCDYQKRYVYNYGSRSAGSAVISISISS